MPYIVNKHGKKWIVINQDTGETVPGGEHATESGAQAHMRALYANVEDAVEKADFTENEHPRAEDGKFASSGGGGAGFSGAKDAPATAAFDSKKKNGKIHRYEDGSIGIETPYDPNFIARAKKEGGKWNSTNKRWEFQKEKSGKAEELFNASYNDMNSQAVTQNKTEVVSQKSSSARSDIESRNQKTDVSYDPKKKTGKMYIGQSGEKVYINSEYDPIFVNGINKIEGRKWYPNEKVWSVPIDSYDQVKELFNRHYNNTGNPQIKTEAEQAVIAAKKEQKAEYAAEAAKTPASKSQLDYIDKLCARYISADGEYVSHKKFGEISKERASFLIDALKGGEEQVSFMGLFER